MVKLSWQGKHLPEALTLLAALVRFLPDGSLDKTFSGDGKQLIGLGSVGGDAKRRCDSGYRQRSSWQGMKLPDLLISPANLWSPGSIPTAAWMDPLEITGNDASISVRT